MNYLRNILLSIIMITLWQLSIIGFKLPPFILPPPLAVLQLFTQQTAILANHAAITLLEIIGGLLLGTAIGFSTALSMATNRYIKYWLKPLLIISQSIPTFAIAPILIFWLGYGVGSKLMITALMIFFPIASNLFDGLERTPPSYLDLAQTLHARPWQILWYIRLPAALPSFASGLRIATAIAPIGAIIGEWVGASQGLGFLMLEANARMQIDLVFAVLVIIIAFSIILYTLIDRLLKRYIPWKMH